MGYTYVSGMCRVCIAYVSELNIHKHKRQPAAVAGDIGEEHAVVGAGSGGKKILKIGVPIRDTPIYKSGIKWYRTTVFYDLQ